jgi:hypothetical protein
VRPRGRGQSRSISETILGQVLTAGQGQNPARQAHINAGLPIEASAWSINQVCGSGLRAVALGAQHVQLGDAAIVLAGGQENMTLSPHCAHLRAGTKMGDMKMIDTMIKDGLWDAFNGYHMGQTAENVAQQWQISREEQDIFAVASQNKAEAAQKAGKFADEIAAFVVKTRKGDIVVDQRRIHPPRRDDGRDGETETRLYQGRVGDRGQCQRPERWRCRRHADERGRSRTPWPDPAGAHCQLRNRRSGPVDHGRGPIHASRARWPRQAGSPKIWIWWKRTKHLPPKPAP